MIFLLILIYHCSLRILRPSASSDCCPSTPFRSILIFQVSNFQYGFAAIRQFAQFGFGFVCGRVTWKVKVTLSCLRTFLTSKTRMFNFTVFVHFSQEWWKKFNGSRIVLFILFWLTVTSFVLLITIAKFANMSIQNNKRLVLMFVNFLLFWLFTILLCIYI